MTREVSPTNDRNALVHEWPSQYFDLTTDQYHVIYDLLSGGIVRRPKDWGLESSLVCVPCGSARLPPGLSFRRLLSRAGLMATATEKVRISNARGVCDLGATLLVVVTWETYVASEIPCNCFE